MGYLQGIGNLKTTKKRGKRLQSKFSLLQEQEEEDEEEKAHQSVQKKANPYFMKGKKANPAIVALFPEYAQVLVQQGDNITTQYSNLVDGGDEESKER